MVERAIAAINARDIEGYLACCTENVKLETPIAAIGGVYEGIDGIGRFFTDIEEAAPDFRIALDAVEESLPIGEEEARGAVRAETRFDFRTGVTSVVPWLVVSDSVRASGDGSTGP